MKILDHLPEMVVRCEDESEEGPGHPTFVRTGMEGAGPSLTWTDPEGHERATISFDWFDGRMRVLLFDASRFSNKPLMLYLDASGAVVSWSTTRGDNSDDGGGSQNMGHLFGGD